MNDTQAERVFIPLEHLESHVLQAIVEAYVLQEGTDYGHPDIDLDTKCKQVLDQLRSGDAQIHFDTAAQACLIVPGHVGRTSR